MNTFNLNSAWRVEVESVGHVTVTMTTTPTVMACVGRRWGERLASFVVSFYPYYGVGAPHLHIRNF